MAASPGGIEVSRISTRVVPDTSHLFADLKVDLDKIERELSLNVKASVDATELVASAREAVDVAQASMGDLDVKTKVDSSQLEEGTRAAEGFSSGLSGIASAALILGPALIPLVAVLGGLGAALAAPAVVGGAGLTLFGFITGAAIKQTEAQNKKLLQLKKAVDSAKQSLSNAQASAATSAKNSLSAAQASAAASLASAQQALRNASTTAQVSAAAQRIQAAHASLSARTSAIQASQSASVAAAQRRVAEATLAYQAALKGMTPAQLTFIRAQDALKSAFHNLLAAVGGSVLGPVTSAMKLLTSIMPKIEPILVSFAKVFEGFLTSAGDAAKGSGFASLVQLIATKGAQSFKSFAEIIGNVFLAFGRLGRALLPFGQSVLAGLGKAAKGFADFAASAKAKTEIKDLLDYIRSVGPKVGQTLGDLAGAVGHLVKAFAPIGGVVLDAIDGLARAVKSIPSAGLATLAASLVVLTAASTALGPLTKVLGVVGLAQPEIIAVVAAAASLVLGFIALYNHSKPLRQVIGDLGDYFKTKLLPPLKDAADKLGPALSSAFDDISHSIKQNKPALETVGKVLLTLATKAVIGGIDGLALAIRGIGKAASAALFGVAAIGTGLVLAARVGVGAFRILTAGVLKAFGVIVDGAASAFGWMPGIGGKVKAARDAFHVFADSVNGDFDGISTKLARLQDRMLALTHQPTTFKITLDTIEADKKIRDLQLLKFADKKLTVNIVERVAAPGGGIGIPGKNSAGAITAPRAVQSPDLSGNAPAPTSRVGSAPLVNVERMEVRDLKDILRQSNNRHRARAGGGVLLGAT